MKRCWLILLCVLLPAMVMAQDNSLPAAPHLLVKGHAAQRYVPDRFTIHLVVDVVDKSPGVGRAKVEAHVKQILDALKKHGALPDRTEASTLAITPKREERNDKQVFVGTEVSRTVDATFDSSDNLRDFLGELTTSEELSIDGVDVKRSDEASIQLDLRKRAIADSQHSAQLIAKAYGLQITGVYSVSEVAPSYSYGLSGGLAGVSVTASFLPEMALSVGTIELNQTIYTVYLTSP